MDIAWIEPFGPVLPIIRVTSIGEAITLANGSKYGLQASIFTNDIDRAVKIANQLDVGSININDAPQRGPDYLPFLGIKDSGMGVQGIREALLSMTRHKGIVFN
jgi:glyceraldehyde-3-phosphate dehydrogenase (NADP+)